MKRKHLYSFITIGLALILLNACAKYNSAESGSSEPVETVSATDLINQADALYRRREDLANACESIVLLKRARAADSGNFEASWKLVQADYSLGKFSPDAKESDKALADGINAARAAIRLNPNKPDGHFWLGANLGGEAEKSPFTKGIPAVGEIRD